jgi:hypothetical protein
MIARWVPESGGFKPERLTVPRRRRQAGGRQLAGVRRLLLSPFMGNHQREAPESLGPQAGRSITTPISSDV